MVKIHQITQNLPSDVAVFVEKLNEKELSLLEEIRLRAGRPLVLTLGLEHRKMPLLVTKNHIDLCVQKISKSSVYAFIEELRNGFITVEGGHRVGISGRAVMQDGSIHNIKNISGINFRVAREIIGCSDKIMPLIYSGAIKNTLIISPPQCGKTTMLRDIARNLGKTRKVSVIDERGEITAMYNGMSGYDLGDMTDVIDLCPKETAITIMLRSMSPDVIITDEIAQGDISSIKQILSCGTSLVASAHGDDVKTTLKRLDMADMFERIILMGRDNGKIVVKNTYEGRNFYDG